MKRLLPVVTGAAFLLAACETEAHHPTQPSTASGAAASRLQQEHPHGHPFRKFRAAESSNYDNSTIVYNGGPIIGAQKVAVIYWSNRTIYNGGPAAGSTGSGAADGSLVGFFLNHLGGSPHYNINTTYGRPDGSLTPQNSVNYTQFWASNSNVPATGSNVAIGAIEAQIVAGFTSGALTFDPNTVYLVFTDSMVNQDNLFPGYCAEHWHFSWNSNDVKFGAMPRDFDQVGCRPWDYLSGAGSPNNDRVADAEVNTIAHETEETNTDPDPFSGWADTNSAATPPGWYENADKCAWMFGPSSRRYTAANGATANMNLGGKDFLIQENWVKGYFTISCFRALLTVSISGPTTIPSCNTYTWNATASGLGSSFTYVWKRGVASPFGGGVLWTQVGGSGPSYSRSVCPGEETFHLAALPTNEFGDPGEAFIYVTP